MAETTTQPHYQLAIHHRAKSNWQAIPTADRDDLKDVLEEAARLRAPSEHSKAALMRDGKGLFRIRKGDYRVLCDKDGARLRILHVGRREGVYDGFGVALERSQDQ